MTVRSLTNRVSFPDARWSGFIDKRTLAHPMKALIRWSPVGGGMTSLRSSNHSGSKPRRPFGPLPAWGPRQRALASIRSSCRGSTHFRSAPQPRGMAALSGDADTELACVVPLLLRRVHSLSVWEPSAVVAKVSPAIRDWVRIQISRCRRTPWGWFS